jgi:hypothetical protein
MMALTVLLLAAVPATGIAAQAQAPAVDERNAGDTKGRLHQILEQYPPSVAQVLRLDPSLLNKADYLAPYPALAAFLAGHPEVAHNPVFFIGSGFGGPGQQFSDSRSTAMRSIESVFIGLEFLLGFATAFVTLGWIARSVIDHRRWLRAMKIQTDAHTKIVDRLASNEDLLAYMQSPAAQRFLAASLGPAVAAEAAPQSVGAPLNRILWSVQAGIVLATCGIGLWFAKQHVMDDLAEPIFVVAILAVALGAGFVLSALASYMLSRQLGLVDATPHA